MYPSVLDTLFLGRNPLPKGGGGEEEEGVLS